MTELKRLPLKYIRDSIKSAYKIKDVCYICGTNKDLELHHLHGLSQLWNEWCNENNIIISNIVTVKEMNELRGRFSKDCEESLSHKYLFSLCKVHHLKLHTIYGQHYHNGLTPKILNWLERMKEKYGLD